MRMKSILLSLFLATGVCAGCDSAGNFSALLADAVGIIQSRSQELPPVLVERGDEILIDADVTIIVNPSVDIVYADLPNLTVLAFENVTDWDIFIKYLADGELQGIYVYQGEALLLSYPCLGVVDLISEDDIDPFTGELVDSFDLTGFSYFNPEDFFCGDALILNFDPFSVNVSVEVIDLYQ